MDRNYCLIVFIVYICHTVIHRKLQNVVYMTESMIKKKKKKKKKKGGGGGGQHLKNKKTKKREQHRVLSASTCGREEGHLFNYWL